MSAQLLCLFRKLFLDIRILYRKNFVNKTSEEPLKDPDIWHMVVD